VQYHPLAAVLWFWSTSINLPLMGSYWDRTPPSDPFYVVLKRSAKINGFAALCSGISALLVFVRMWLSS
jgi:hypothetical protein